MTTPSPLPDGTPRWYAEICYCWMDPPPGSGFMTHTFAAYGATDIEAIEEAEMAVIRYFLHRESWIPG